MVYQIIRWWATLFLRVYFRKTIIHGMEYIPPDGPLIVASNHPSAFLEASILGTVLKRPLHYLVRGDMFHPRFKWLFDWTNQIPIYRQKDGISNLRKNASSFELTYQKLAEGDAVLIFPEAKTILEKRMRPIQRGTAHLAFGTLPYLKSGEELRILPVGVNFTEPRFPGTDVVIRFGPSFVTERATREDREAIERFTDHLSDVLSPLIIQVADEAYDKHYDALASVYLKCMPSNPDAAGVHDDLRRVSDFVNQHKQPDPAIHQVHEYLHHLKQNRIPDALYYPDLLRKGRLHLLGLLCFKWIWLLAGGWIWRVARNIIFSKIKANTFKTPVTVGAAMVLYPLVLLILILICLIAGWPVWIPWAWLLLMFAGSMVRPSASLITQVLLLQPKSKSLLKKQISAFVILIKGIL